MNPILDEEFFDELDAVYTRESDELARYDQLQEWLDQEMAQ